MEEDAAATYGELLLHVASSMPRICWLPTELRIEVLLCDKKLPKQEQVYLGKWHILYPHETPPDEIGFCVCI